MTKQEILKNFDEEIAYWNGVVDETYAKYSKGGMEFHDFKAKYFDAMARVETFEYAKEQLEEMQ